MKSDATILNLKCSYKLELLITSSYVCPRVVRSSQALGTSCEIFHMQANMVSRIGVPRPFATVEWTMKSRATRIKYATSLVMFPTTINWTEKERIKE